MLKYICTSAYYMRIKCIARLFNALLKYCRAVILLRVFVLRANIFSALIYIFFLSAPCRLKLRKQKKNEVRKTFAQQKMQTQKELSAFKNN